MDASPICTLDSAETIRRRITDWQQALSRAADREPIEGGVALRFGHDAALTTELARLAAAEHECCGFFDFTISIDSGGVRLDVRAPDTAQEAVTAVFGAAS